jgi:hypothetical protein
MSLITDQSVISSFNRGPITTLFKLLASCTATQSAVPQDVTGTAELFFGHFWGFLDPACYPTPTPGVWDVYYCMLLFTTRTEMNKANDQSRQSCDMPCLWDRSDHFPSLSTVLPEFELLHPRIRDNSRAMLPFVRCPRTLLRTKTDNWAENTHTFLVVAMGTCAVLAPQSARP